MDKKTKFAIGCLVQWYEVEVLEEYVDSLMEAIDEYGKENVRVNITFTSSQKLEKIDGRKATLVGLRNKYGFIVKKLVEGGYDCVANLEEAPVTIADYRRDFNNYYCNHADVLMWGEADMLVPKQAFVILDTLHQRVPQSKYIATFGICKMWDDSWKPLEHPEFTVKPFIENDYSNWWSLKYTMTKEEMNKINERTERPSLQILPQHKFNGCGLVISSEIIKAGVNIPQSVFFVHEDTAFMLMLQKVLPDSPQYVINNILNVHNRNHPKKRMYVLGETGDTLNQKRRSNDWYVKANKYSEENCYNLFNPNHKSKTWEDVWQQVN